jgi:dienelactone hydrolase
VLRTLIRTHIKVSIGVFALWLACAIGLRQPGSVAMQATPPSAMPAVGPDTSLLALPGPYGVGVTTIAVGATKVEVWYPTARVADASTTYDLRSWLNAPQQKKVPAKSLPSFAVKAAGNAPPKDDVGPFPIVLYSHDSGSIRLEAPYLALHLASWGFAVAAPDHLERGFSLRFAGQPDSKDVTADVKTLSNTLRALTTVANKSGLLRARLDTASVLVVGRGRGADAAIRFTAGNEQVLGIVAISGGAAAQSKLPEPLRPTLWISTANDKTVSALAIRKKFETSRSPRRLVALSSGGHEATSLWCELRNASPAVKKPPEWANVRKSFADGCDEASTTSNPAWPIVKSQTLAEFRTILGAGTPGFGLDQETLNALSKSGATPASFAIG